MLNLIEVNENGVVYVSNDVNENVYGIVNAFEILSGDGIKLEGSAMDVLESLTDIEQDYENECNVITLECGSTLTLSEGAADVL